MKSRGLINSTLGPELKRFPFYEDGSTIFASLRKFMESFVSSYYENDAAVASDVEIQAWVREANGPAKARDFPSLNNKKDLIDALNHMVSLSLS